MKRARLGMLVGALAAIGLWLPLLSRPKPGADESPRGATQRGAAVAETKYEAPAPLPVARAPEAPAAEAPPAHPAKTADDPNAPFAFEETADDLRERATEREELGARFARESADATWTDESGRRVAELLAKSNLQSGALSAVDCRQTICRFVLASSSTRGGEVRGLIQAARDLDQQTWLHPEKQGDDTWRMEVFFPKDGYWLSGGGGRIDETKPVVDAPGLERSSKGG